MRFHSPLPTKLNELAALVTIRYWGAQFPWYAHHRAAAQAGLDESIISAIGEGKQPVFTRPEEQAAYDFCAELLRTKQTGDNTFRTVKERVGERGVVELMGVMGYYQVSLNDFEHRSLPHARGNRTRTEGVRKPDPLSQNADKLKLDGRADPWSARVPRTRAGQRHALPCRWNRNVQTPGTGPPYRRKA